MSKSFTHFNAICMSEVGEQAISHAIAPLFHVYQSILITNASDLYDYLTTHAK